MLLAGLTLLIMVCVHEIAQYGGVGELQRCFDQIKVKAARRDIVLGFAPNTGKGAYCSHPFVYKEIHMPRAWWPHNETVEASSPCGVCGESATIHLGYAPTKGIRYMGVQVAGWSNADIAACGNCGRIEGMGTEGRQMALQSGTWEITGVLGLGYIDIEKGKLLRRPRS